MGESKSPIHDVSDTAFWVAYYRSVESARPDALFQDPLATVLLDERGYTISKAMQSTSAHTQHNVILRTVIIDDFIRSLVASGADTVINLGAGLDTRPYRLDLPPTLRWIEIDYPHLIDFKNQRLQHQKPRVSLERIALDLADVARRQQVFEQLNASCRSAVILTEGVLPYLTPEQVSSLSQDLQAMKNFRHWIADYLSSSVYKYLRSKKRVQLMKNAPFVFFPNDWFGFFKSRGWSIEKITYIPEESIRLGRQIPLPWWFFLVRPLIPPKMQQQFLKSSGYMVMKKI